MMTITSFDEDSLNLREFSERLEHFIETEQEFVDGGLVLSLTSPFGTGKTTFLRMWQSELETSSFVVIPLNAWESDYFGDPLYAIVSNMLSIIDEKDRAVKKISNAVKDLGWMSVAIGSQIVKTGTGIDPVAAGEFAERKKSQRENSQNVLNSFAVYENRKNAMGKLKEAVSDYISTSGKTLLFLVDELDRCRPDYAISYLETIKHIFDLKGAVFVLAIDRHQLENSAKSEFGQDLNFEEYFRKFIQREIHLPKINETGYRNLSRKYVDYYLTREGIRTCVVDIESNIVDDLIELIVGLKLTPRQIQEIFRILGHIFEAPKSNEGKLRELLALSSIVMAALRVGDRHFYEQLGEEGVGASEVVSLFQDDLKLDSAGWWFMLFYSGGSIQRETEAESLKHIVERAGLKDLTHVPHEDIWRRDWGYARASTNQFKNIYKRIEELMSWL